MNERHALEIQLAEVTEREALIKSADSAMYRAKRSRFGFSFAL